MSLPKPDLYARRRELIDQINQQGFEIEVEDLRLPGELAGCRLDQPVCFSKVSDLCFQISWPLAERLARGEVKTISV